MKNADGFIAEMNPDLTVNRLEVAASPMLGLVEVRSRRPLGHGRGKVDHTYYDRREASKLSIALEEAVQELEKAGAALEGEEVSTKAAPDEPFVPNDISPARYVAVREVGGGWRVLDRETWHVLAAIFAGDPEGLEDAERWARQLNESASMAAAEQATRAAAGEARAA